jgi:hypothetical protein
MWPALQQQQQWVGQMQCRYWVGRQVQQQGWRQLGASERMMLWKGLQWMQGLAHMAVPRLLLLLT